MGILDDAKDRLGDAAEWAKDKASNLGEQAHAAGLTVGEKAADARHWVESRVSGDHGAPDPDARIGGGGTFATDWVDASERTDAGAAPTATPDAAANGDRPADVPGGEPV